MQRLSELREAAENRHILARFTNACLECGAEREQACVYVHNAPLGKPMRHPWSHESRLEDELVQHMRKAAREEAAP